MREIRECLSGFRFKELFTEHLFWDASKGTYPVESGEELFEVQAVANKKGLVALVCQPAEGSPFPNSAERKRIEREVNELHREHLIVFVDREQTRQVWQVPKREGGKTTGHSEVPFFKGKGVEHLARRIEAISFTLDESENVSLIEVAARVNQALLAEKVTKKFFKEFSDQRKAFLKFLDWIEDESKRDWYCSVLLNRLMFIYFIAEKGFLPEGKAFLSQGLEANAKVNGSDTFYTHFLLPLSFFGFGEPQGKRGHFEQQFKGVLYLNGGLFAVHSLERELGISKEAVESVSFPTGVMIPDSEFRKWFGYFDSWRWTLDEDKVENEGHISPHILGYIFEKYINQKQMGAYYTKEDITGYICRNTIIPRLFDMLAETGDKGKQAVDPLPIGPHPNLLNDGRGISGGEGIDRYVYTSVKQEEKLPTETDYEQGQRRSRYEALLTEFDFGGFRTVDDFITSNLDIEKLALDFVENIQDADVLHRFYFRGLQSITVLDPTCGSGAFLFAGLGILYPLYNAALSRMRYLVGKSTGVEPDVVNWAGRLNFDDLDSGQGVFADQVGGDSKSIQEMKAEVERINDHPSAEYFIKKSIIVNNLFGVDIMEEAVEICKLRLFLSLIATVERDDAKPNMGVEPLPDIDFNILAGNTLVGYASIADIDRLWNEVEIGTSTLAFEKDHSKLKTDLAFYGKRLQEWRRFQLGEWEGLPIDKQLIIAFAKTVKDTLNQDLWRLYRTGGLLGGKRTLTQHEFEKSHEPFHWLLEFPTIEASGGFDVIVGNPPYKVFEAKNSDYSLLPAGFASFAAKNLYAFVAERSLRLAAPTGYVSMIVPLTVTSSERVSAFQELLLDRGLITLLSFPRRPESVFDGVEMPVTIFVCGHERRAEWHSSAVRRFYTVERESAIQVTNLSGTAARFHGYRLAKVGSRLHTTTIEKLVAHTSTTRTLVSPKTSDNDVYYQEACRYWMKAQVGLPFFRKNGVEGEPAHGRTFYVVSEQAACFLACLLSSSLFYLFYSTFSDCEHVNDSLVKDMPIPDAWDQVDWTSLWLRLQASMTSHSRRKTIHTKQGHTIEYDELDAGRTKPAFDDVDSELARLYGFSSEEAEFIVNYDLKYRMGQGTDEEDGS